jgi:hypothetical protein
LVGCKNLLDDLAMRKVDSSFAGYIFTLRAISIYIGKCGRNMQAPIFECMSDADLQKLVHVFSNEIESQYGNSTDAEIRAELLSAKQWLDMANECNQKQKLSYLKSLREKLYKVASIDRTRLNNDPIYLRGMINQLAKSDDQHDFETALMIGREEGIEETEVYTS